MILSVLSKWDGKILPAPKINHIAAFTWTLHALMQWEEKKLHLQNMKQGFFQSVYSVMQFLKLDFMTRDHTHNSGKIYNRIEGSVWAHLSSRPENQTKKKLLVV